MNALGAVGVGLMVLLENLFPPIPSEVILPLAGFAAANPEASFTWWQALIWATVGSVAGAYALYGLGAWLGHDRTVKLLVKLPLVDVDEINATIRWFNRHGYWTVFLGRMVPIFRSLISLPAGIERMSWWKFGLFTLLGSAIWNTIFVLAGFYLGENWHIAEQYASVFSRIVVVVVLVAVIWWVLKRIRRNRQARSDT